MGNRAVIALKNEPNAPGIYVHWNGGPESVLAFIDAARELGARMPGQDDTYFLADLVACIGLFMGIGLSKGIATLTHLDTGNGDNGLYIVGPKGEIAARLHTRDTRASLEDLATEDRLKYESTKATIIARARLAASTILEE
jgi:hypothetical protein